MAAGTDTADHKAALYQGVVAQVTQASAAMVEAVVKGARRALKERAAQERNLQLRDQLEQALTLLDSHGRTLCLRYPDALSLALQERQEPASATAQESVSVLAGLHFDQLELMDSDQVQQSVALARAQQSTLLVADSNLAALEPYICSALGLTSVQSHANPLRPEVFLQALQAAIEQTQAPVAVRLLWLEHMSAALGHELNLLYRDLAKQFRGQGVAPVGYTVTRTVSAVTARTGADAVPGVTVSRPSPVSAAGAGEQAVLTLDRLRSLLLGELDQAPDANPAMMSFAAQFSREFESDAQAASADHTDFAATVPAAFEALQEMNQLDHMVERLGHRRRAEGTGTVRPKPSMRQQLQTQARGLGQVLSLEVVALMVDNIARDARLLKPIRELVKELEPALLRLALVDPRFFSDKQHPARRLLQEITHRSLAYESEDARDFAAFLLPLQVKLRPLGQQPVEDARPFEQVLQQLTALWAQRAQPQQLEQAVKALEHAEKRNFLAAKLAREVEASSDAQKLPTGVLGFLCGPWSQVMAHARLADSTGAADPGQYRELVAALVWSAQPLLTRKDIGRLTKLVPVLLGKLREGLGLIDYPALKTSEFFELLMNLHQQAFKPSAPVNPPPSDGLASVHARDELWLAPSEAKASGFLDLSEDEPAAPVPASSAVAEQAIAADKASVPPTQVVAELPVGSWVEMQVAGAWVRSQLSWASPQGTLFLFTSVYGSTQSITRRSRDKLLQSGHMRVVSGEAIVNTALDGVAQTAMQNSLDLRP